MPRPKKKFRGDPPPIDWLWGAILERQKVYGLDLIQMAEIAGIPYNRMRDYINQSPWDWNREVRERVCDCLGIVTKVSVGPTSQEDVKVMR